MYVTKFVPQLASQLRSTSLQNMASQMKEGWERKFVDGMCKYLKNGWKLSLGLWTQIRGTWLKDFSSSTRSSESVVYNHFDAF